MNKPNIAQYIKEISLQLLPTYQDPHLAQSHAWLLVEKLFNKTKTELITQNIAPLSSQQNENLKKWLHLLIDKKMPIQYIIGSVIFNDLEIVVEPPILIPRPETQEWVMNLIDQLKQLKNQNLYILDIATGSGCIALTLAHHFPLAHIIATDISLRALQLAKKNSAHNALTNVTFMQSDVFDSICGSQQFDIIVSNPPYIAQSERHIIDESVLNWEDEQALFAHDNGLAIIKKIIDQAPSYIKPNNEIMGFHIPQLIIEIGYQQGNLVKDYMINAQYNNVQVWQDMHNNDRVVVGRISNVANCDT